jgi:SnoaL-like domain
MLTTIDDASRRAALIRYLSTEGLDRDASHELYHEDAILEFPQSGERFVGRDTFKAWRERYPSPTEFRLRRLMGHGNYWWAELLVAYDGRPPMFGVGLYEFRDHRVAREIVYVMEGWEAPAWRAPWNTPFDRLASIAPSGFREAEPFGLEAELEIALSTRSDD